VPPLAAAETSLRAALERRAASAKLPPEEERPPAPGARPSSSLRTAERVHGQRGGGDQERPSSTEPSEVLVRISMHAGGESLSYIYEFVARFAKDRYRRVVAESVGLAAFELLENGFCYSSISSPVVLELVEQGPWVIVRVSNNAIAARTGLLREQVAKLAQDAQATYLDQVQRSVGNGARARLGLARVAHEGGMRLDLNISGDRVVVSAYCKS
jgi:hypothetical protein